MTRRARAFLYAMICLALIVLAYFRLPASFYTLATSLGILAIFFVTRGLRAGAGQRVGR